MERYCSTGQSPQRAVAPTEEEEEEDWMHFTHTTAANEAILFFYGQAEIMAIRSVIFSPN